MRVPTGSFVTALLWLTMLCLAPGGVFALSDALTGSAPALRESLSLERPYDWYMAQQNTGDNSSNNCAPTCAVMAEMWADGFVLRDVEEARLRNSKGGADWHTEDIVEALRAASVRCEMLRGSGVEAFVEHLNKGRILIVGFNTGSVVYTPKSRDMTGRFYPGNSWHSVVIKGYRQMRGSLYFQVYDPDNADFYYTNGEPMGKDRLYDAFEMNNSCYEAYIVVYDD